MTLIYRTERNVPAALSPRERQVVSLVAEGFSNREIGVLLDISQHTVKNHMANIFDKLGVGERTSVAMFAVGAGLVSGEVAA